MMKKAGWVILTMLPGLILMIGVKTFFSPCIHADGTVSTCADCGQEIFRAGIVLTFLALMRAVVTKNRKAVSDGVAVLISLCIFLMPFLLKTCMMQSMRCNTLMKPCVWLVSAAGMALYTWLFAHDMRITKGKKHV